MSDIGFISLPFQPMKSMKTPFYFSTAIWGEYLANLFGGTYYLGINSLHSFKLYDEEEYSEFEKKFDFINKKVVYYDRDFIDGVSQIISQLYKSKDIRIISKVIGVCDCGRVELTRAELVRLSVNKVGMQLVEEKEGEFICKHCKKKLIFQNVESLFLCFKDKELYEEMGAHPGYLDSDLNHFRKSLRGNQMRISRVRNTNVPVVIETKQFYLDIDILWKFIPLLLNNKMVVVVASAKHMFSLFVINYLSKIMKRKSVYFVGLPFIQTDKLTDEILHFYSDNRHKNALKLLVVLGIGWSKKNIFLQEATCKYFMSSKTKNNELIEYIYSKVFEENDWLKIRKKIFSYTQLQTVLNLRKYEIDNRRID